MTQSDEKPFPIRHKTTGEKAMGYPSFNKETRVLTFYRNVDNTEPYEAGMWEYIPQEPYELFGIECGKGWYTLLQPILNYIETYNRDKREQEQIVIQQIKSKWGELRVYVSFETPELAKLIHAAEDEASRTCELCGATTDVGFLQTGWLTVICRECLLKNDKRTRDAYWRCFADKQTYIVHPDKTMTVKQ